MCAPAVAAHPLRGWMFVNSEILFVLTIVIKICYPSYLSPSVSSSQSDHSLTSHQQDIFFSKTIAHWMLLFFVVVSYFTHNSKQRLLYLEIQGEEQYSSTSGINNIIIIKVIDVQFVPLSDVSCEH